LAREGEQGRLEADGQNQNQRDELTVHNRNNTLMQCIGANVVDSRCVLNVVNPPEQNISD
jgi:hypothetical protein